MAPGIPGWDGYKMSSGESPPDLRKLPSSVRGKFHNFNGQAIPAQTFNHMSVSSSKNLPETLLLNAKCRITGKSAEWTNVFQAHVSFSLQMPSTAFESSDSVIRLLACEMKLWDQLMGANPVFHSLPQSRSFFDKFFCQNMIQRNIFKETEIKSCISIGWFPSYIQHTQLFLLGLHAF
jgi:hypothetical protein